MFDSLRRCLISKLRKTFYISNFVTLMRPYIYSISVFGFFPYNVDLSSYKLDKINFIKSTLGIIQLTIFCPIVIYKLRFTRMVRNESYIMLHIVSVYTFGLLGLWASFSSSRLKLRLLRMISYASRVLSPAEFCSTAKWMFPVDILKLCLFLTYLTAFKQELWELVTCLISFYIFFEAMIVTTLFSNCLYVLNLCFRKINTSLETLKVSLATDEPHLLRRVYHTQKNAMLLSELKTLRSYHLEFSRIIVALNETFGSENIVIIAMIIIDITFNLYVYVAHNTVDGRIVNVWSMNIEYLTYNCLSLIGVALICDNLRSQVKNIGFNIHRILIMTFDEEISTELELFSVQVLMHCSTITAKGLVLDVTLLTKVVGIITTYLLILIQFLLTKPC